MQVGQFQVERELGRGGMGVVYLARDPAGEAVVLKLLKAGQVARPDQRERLRREGQALARLRHPNIVRMRGVTDLEGMQALVLEYVPGQTLQARLDAEGPWVCRDAAELVLTLAAAVRHAHAEGVLHRDLKPENVLMDAGSGEPRLTDFGLVRLADSVGESLTVTGQLMGSPGYWAPEQARGNKSLIGPGTDVFGLGAILYALLSGSAPAQGATLAELLAAMAQPPRPISTERPDVDPALERICLRCLQRTPHARYPSVAELEEALEDYLTNPQGPSAGVGAWMILAGGLAVLAVGVGVSVVGLTKASTPPTSTVATSRPPLPQVGPTPSPSAGNDARVRAEAHWARARAAVRARRFGAARQELDALLAIDPDRPMAYTVRARVRRKQRDLPGALADYDEALRRNPRDVVALLGRGQSRQEAGRPDLAWDDFARALQLDPRQAHGYRGRAAILLGRGDHVGALKAANAGVRLAPNDPPLRYARGCILTALKRLDEAEADFEVCIRLDRNDAAGWLGRGNVRSKRGDLPGAISDYDRSLRLDPGDPDVLGNRAWAKQLSGDRRGALVDFAASLQINPKRAQTWIGRALTRRALGDHVGAAEDFEQLRRIAPQIAAGYARSQGFRLEDYIRKHLGRAPRW